MNSVAVTGRLADVSLKGFCYFRPSGVVVHLRGIFQGVGEDDTGRENESKAGSCFFTDENAQGIELFEITGGERIGHLKSHQTGTGFQSCTGLFEIKVAQSAREEPG